MKCGKFILIYEKGTLNEHLVPYQNLLQNENIGLPNIL